MRRSKHGGTFILRIEDTDRQRFVPDSERTIEQLLAWAGIAPTESPSMCVRAMPSAT